MCVQNSPCRSLLFSPATALEKYLIASVLMIKMTDQLGTPRGRYDEYSNKFPSVRNQGFIVQEKVNTPEGDAC
jgi:hypothetical protein